MSEATPRPWRISKLSPWTIEIESRGVANTGGPQNNIEPDCGQGENEANAALIVRAVNSHDQLVEAAEAITTWVDCNCDEAAIDLDKLRAALSAAKGDG